MQKKIRIILITVGAAAIIGAGICWLGGKIIPESDSHLAVEETQEREIEVKINANTQTPIVYEKIIDEETGETVVAEVQENAPPETKPTEPPEKPKSNESYTNPEAPPQYSEEQVKVTEKPKSQPTPEQKTNDGGRVYVEGFGYIETGASTQSKTGQSSGDINKMVGTMD